MTSNTTRIADFISAYFFELGIRNVYSLPGGGAMHLIDAFTKHQGLNHISFFHEQAASVAAESAARTADNEVAVCCVTTGPGATNAITAVAGAWIESTPLIIISGQVKRADMLEGRKLRQTGVQEVEITKLVDSITKYACVIKDPYDTLYILQRAFYEATSGRKGPVWIDVPLDVQGAPLPNINDLKQFQPPQSASEQNIPISIIGDLLKKCKKPLFFWGNGAKADAQKTRVHDVIKKYSLPSVFTWNACDIIEYEHEMYVGRPGVVAQRHPNICIQNADLIICLGTSLDNVLTAYNPLEFGRNAKKVVINIDQNQLDELKMKDVIPVCSSVSHFLDVFVDYMDNEPFLIGSPNWKQELTRLKDRFQDDFPNETDDDGLISHKDFVLCLSEILDEGQLIATGSSGLAIEAFYMMFRNKRGQSYHLTSGLGSMGFGLPSAIGLAVENSDQDVVLVESDGSFCMNIQELQTVINNNLPICIFLMNNSGYASIRNTQSNYFSNRFFGTGIEAGQKMPNWKGIVEGYGITYLRVDDLAQLFGAYRDFKAKRSVVVIDILLTKNEKLLPKCSALPQNDGTIISMPLEDMAPLLELDDLNSLMHDGLSASSVEARKQ
jgi:acetolactate synthase-1/2/3 large subunit